MNVKLQEGRPNKRKKMIAKERERKNRRLPHFSQLSGSAHVPLRSVHPPFRLSVHSFCPMALASIWFPSVRFIPSSHPVSPSSHSVHLSISTVHPPVLSICPSLLSICSSLPSSLLNLPVYPLSPSKLTFRFLKFPSGPPGQPGPSPLKKKIFFGGDKGSGSRMPCCQAERGGTDVAGELISACGIENNHAYVT